MTEWAAVEVAPNRVIAEMWQEILKDEGIPSVIEAGSEASFLGISSLPCRLMVPEERLEEARTVLSEIQVEDVPPEETQAEGAESP